MRGMCFVGYAARAQLRSAIKISYKAQIWSNALERTNHHDDTLPLAPVQLVEKKRKKADFPLPVGRLTNTSLPCTNALTTLSCWGSSVLYPSFVAALDNADATSLSAFATLPGIRLRGM